MKDSPEKQSLLDLYNRSSNAVRWQMERRPDQTPPADDLWDVWILAGGRGGGKTRTGAEEVRIFADNNPGSRILLVAPSLPDIRHIMIEGESGILNVYDLDDPNMPTWKPSERRIVWPNGAQAIAVSAEEPDAFRGISADFTWCDEVANWRVPPKKSKDLSAWDEVRIASRGKILVTTTPFKTKSLKILHRSIKKNPVSYRLTLIGRLSNSDNLNKAYVQSVSRESGGWPWSL